jgi:hypothetical protein
MKYRTHVWISSPTLFAVTRTFLTIALGSILSLCSNSSSKHVNLVWEKIALYLSLQIRLDYLIFLPEDGVVKPSGDAFLQEKINGW